jgi:Glycosyl transferase family 2
MKYFSIAAIFKQENPFLKEWMDYYLLTGTDHFYLCCNDEDDKEAKEILAPYWDKITYYHCSDPFLHVKHYTETLKNHRDETRWLAFIDLDEFILPVEKPNIPVTLEEYEKYGGLVLNMVCFGSSGLKEGPTSQINQLIYRLPDYCGMPGHAFIKSIVNPKVTIGHYNNQTHACAYHEGYFAVNPSHRVVNDIRTLPEVSKKVRINHYYTRSLKWWQEVKMPRGRSDKPSNLNLYVDDTFLTVEANATVLDTLIRDKFSSEYRQEQ